jgi:hypothetical protein
MTRRRPRPVTTQEPFLPPSFAPKTSPVRSRYRPHARINRYVRISSSIAVRSLGCPTCAYVPHAARGSRPKYGSAALLDGCRLGHRTSSAGPTIAHHLKVLRLAASSTPIAAPPGVQLSGPPPAASAGRAARHRPACDDPNRPLKPPSPVRGGQRPLTTAPRCMVPSSACRVGKEAPYAAATASARQ